MDRPAIQERLKMLRRPAIYGAATGFTVEMLFGENFSSKTAEEIAAFEAIAAGLGSFSLATMYASRGADIGQSIAKGGQYGTGLVAGQLAGYCFRESMKYFWR